MIGKLIAFGSDRATAMDRMSRALDEFVIRGIKTTVPIGQAILKDPDFRRGRYTTHFVENFLKQRAPMLPPRDE
jgi:acetyl-CoA carboxylase biotin carboxylase subunit